MTKTDELQKAAMLFFLPRSSGFRVHRVAFAWVSPKLESLTSNACSAVELPTEGDVPFMNAKPATLLLTALFSFAGAVPVIQAQTGTNTTITMVNVQASLEKTIDAKKSKTGDAIAAKVSEATQLSDGTKIPAGSILTGHVDSVTPSESKGDSTAVVTFDKVQIKNGKELGVKATITGVSQLAADAGGQEQSSGGGGRRSGGGGGGGGGNGGGGGGGAMSAPAGQPAGLPTPHAIDGLTLSGSPTDATSATFTQAKKNVHLAGGVLLVISVAPLPAAPQ
jgi:uncharacterized membrane protein YgcG